MSRAVTVKIAGRKKDVSRKVAVRGGNDLEEFARKAAWQRTGAVQARRSSPWDDLLGSVSIDAPPATNVAVRKAMRSKGT